MGRLRVPVVLSLCLLAWSGCQRTSLSRGAATKIIAQKLALPDAGITVVDKLYYKSSRAGDGDPLTEAHCRHGLISGNSLLNAGSHLNTLQASGMIVYGDDVTRREKGDYYGQLCIRRYASVKLTDAGRRYLQSEHSENYIMKAYEIGMGEVTGIQIDGSATRAVVEYSLVVLNATPFAENVPASPMRRRASFSLYDDGWRMQE